MSNEHNMAATNSTATDNQNLQQKQPDSSRMTIADIPPLPPPATITSSIPTKSAAKEQHQQKPKQRGNESCAALAQTLNTLLGIGPDSRHMELSQIELMYRAEGNANLVLALPQFKKVLRLPKMRPTTNINTNSNSTSISSKITNTTQQEQQQKHKRPAENPQEDGQQQQEEQQRHSVSVSSLNQNARVDCGELTMADFVGYIEIIRHLIGSEFVFQADIVRIPKEEDRQWINAHIKQARPAERLDKEFCGEFGLLLPDATHLPITFDILLSNLQAEFNDDTYAIEIKPKQGWLLPCDINDLFDIKPTMQTTIATATPTGTAAKIPKLNNRCRYCAMQFLKLQQKKINKRSRYCPLELFSGMPTRMLAALNALLECPQNNLRIFRNGILIYGDQHQSSSSLQELQKFHFPGDKLQLIKDLVVKCLLRDYEGNNGGEEEQSATVEIVKAVAGQPHLSAARTAAISEQDAAAATRASTHQPKSHTGASSTTTTTTTEKPMEVDMAGMAPAMQAQITELEMLCLPKNCVLQKILHLQLLAKHNLHALHNAGYAKKSEKLYNTLCALLEKRADDISLENLSPIEQYVLGATALDCSVLLAFREVTIKDRSSIGKLAPHLVELPEYEKSFVTKITLVDLDPKPDSHFHKYVNQTRKAYSCSPQTE